MITPAYIKAHEQTIRNYLRKPENAGVVREITGHGRNRFFQADEIFQAVQGSW